MCFAGFNVLSGPGRRDEYQTLLQKVRTGWKSEYVTLSVDDARACHDCARMTKE